MKRASCFYSSPAPHLHHLPSQMLTFTANIPLWFACICTSTTTHPAPSCSCLDEADLLKVTLPLRCRLHTPLRHLGLQLLELVPALAPYKKIIDDIIKGMRLAAALTQLSATRRFSFACCLCALRRRRPHTGISPWLHSRRHFRRVSAVFSRLFAPRAAPAAMNFTFTC